MMKAGVPGTVRARIFQRDGYRCRLCGLTGRRVRFDGGGYGHPTDVVGVYLSIDHIIPRSRGGTSKPDNLRVLCTPCNTRKGVAQEVV
jgi:5-methylcytosine-specific restriction endonuclease McrA